MDPLNGKTNAELVEIRRAIESDPKNRMPPGGLFIYTPVARRKLDKIDRAIANNLRAAMIARGEPPNDEGYSGRQSNRSR